MRIREMIETGRAFTAADVAAQQMDVRDVMALRYLPHAIRAAERADQPEAMGLLQAWNGEAQADSRAAALFYTWYEVLRRRVGADEYGKQTMYFPRATLNRILDAGGSPWVNDVRTDTVETLQNLAGDAMREAIDSVGNQRWGDLHTTRINHTLGTVAALARALDLNIGPFPNRGSPNTVNVAGYGIRLPFTNTYGASQRHVVDMADPDGTGGFVIPAGQSGLPFSKHYRDQTPLWRTGRLWLIPLERTKAEARVVHRMTLRPR